MLRPQLTAAVTAVLLGLSPLAAFAANDRRADDVVVATVNGANIYLSEVEESRERLPERYQGLPTESLFQLLVNSLIDSKLAAAEARRRGLHESADVKRQMERIDEQVLERALLIERIEKGVTDAALAERYQQLVADTKGQEEIHARHILVESEAEAREVIGALKKGGDFTELARQRSIDPTAENGGDLGFFRREEMIAPIADPAFALADGAVTEEPVKTQYGWHVIKTEARRPAQVPEFAEVAEQLRADLSRDLGMEVMQDLRKGADIQHFGPEGPSEGPNKKSEGPKKEKK